ncbi:MAG: LOG family protein [Candidatus Omnitrophota bacterium]
MKKNICTFGSYKEIDCLAREEILKLGVLLAQNGYTVVSGGFGGTMEDISRGAKSVGGKTIGVTYYKDGKRLGKRANAYIDEEIVASDIFERIKLMMEKSDAFVVFPGGTGTLLELAALFEYMNKGFMDFKPVIMMGQYWRPVIEVLRPEPLLNMAIARENGFLNCADLVTFVSSAQEAMEELIKKGN